MAYSGKLILIVGPTGSGKGTLVARAREKFGDIFFPVSYTTRAMRPGETDGMPYKFISQEAFDEMIQKNQFLEWAEFDGGKKYGTPKGDVINALEEGKTIIKEVEVQGATQILASLPKQNVVIVFIDVGSWGDLERRIKGRAPMSDEELYLRAERFVREMKFLDQADFTLRNPYGELEQSTQDFFTLIEKIKGNFSFT
jgi:guanylate kinase